jgi:N-acetylglucosamine PTS system EIICBA or EIICB component
MTGLFPMMLFGLPAMCLAMYHTARPENRAKLVGMLTGAALISFFTGITEPIEFLFYYASPVLLIMHAVLGAIFAFIVGVMNIQLGFGFSAGFIDYLISLPNSLKIVEAKKAAGIYNGFTALLANPFMLLAVGPFTAASYYFLGKFLIKKTNAMTPGREQVVEQQEVSVQTTSGQVIKTKVTKSKYSELTGDIYDMIGQKDNINNVD